MPRRLKANISFLKDAAGSLLEHARHSLKSNYQNLLGSAAVGAGQLAHRYLGVDRGLTEKATHAALSALASNNDYSPATNNATSNWIPTSQEARLISAGYRTPPTRMAGKHIPGRYADKPALFPSDPYGLASPPASPQSAVRQATAGSLGVPARGGASGLGKAPKRATLGTKAAAPAKKISVNETRRAGGTIPNTRKSPNLIPEFEKKKKRVVFKPPQ